MMSSYMTKLEFPPELYMIFRLGKHSHICCLFCIKFSQALLMPYERFVMLLKSRSRTHHPHMHYSYTSGRRRNMPSIQIHPKIFYSYSRSEHKNMLDRFSIHQINAPSSCYYLSKVLLQKRSLGYAKVIHKKKKKKRKNGQVSEIYKTMGTQMPA